MRNYSVMLEGTGCRIRIGEWESRPDLSTVETAGFFTTRFVRAVSPEEAAERAKAMVEAELRSVLVNQSTEEVTIAIVEIGEDPDSFDEYAPGRGFSWYTERPDTDNDESIH